jgi:glyoxylase-like metal-dependent hydrolase (beta-lactamase superfamily II)
MAPKVRAFYDEETYTVTYLVWDAVTRDALIIDPVLNYDVFASETSPAQAEELLRTLEQERLQLRVILETHAHADHLSSAQYLKSKSGAPVAMGKDISLVQATFKPIFNLPESTRTDGSQFDLLLSPDAPVDFGSLRVLPLGTPGHTPACLSYLIGDAVFTGDALFMEDYGTGRTDFPAGSAEALYHSVHEVLYQLPNATRVFVGHDYQPGGRAVRYETSIASQKEQNIQLRASTTRQQFVELRRQRDKTLRAPRLIYQSVQVNVFGGLLPGPEGGAGRFLKIPLNRRTPTDACGVPTLRNLESSQEGSHRVN